MVVDVCTCTHTKMTTYESLFAALVARTFPRLYSIQYLDALAYCTPNAPLYNKCVKQSRKGEIEKNWKSTKTKNEKLHSIPVLNANVKKKVTAYEHRSNESIRFFMHIAIGRNCNTNKATTTMKNQRSKSTALFAHSDSK